jgi:hypothetical protein
MNQSEQINELATALSKAQGEMQAAIKDSVNPFFKSKYADLGSVWDAARPVLSKHGLCVLQSTEIVSDKVVMSTILAHSSGQWVKSYLPLNPAKNDNQGMGAAMTYLRRYSLSALVGVVCDDDDDNETAVGRGKMPPKPEKISIHQLQSLTEALGDDDDYRKVILEHYKIKSLADLTPEQHQVCLRKALARRQEQLKTGTN